MQRFFSALQRSPKKAPEPQVHPIVPIISTVATASRSSVPHSFHIRHVPPRFKKEVTSFYNNPEALNTAYKRAQRQLFLAVRFLVSQHHHTTASEQSSESFNTLYTYLNVASALATIVQFRELNMVEPSFANQMKLITTAMTNDKPKSTRDTLQNLALRTPEIFTDHCGDTKSLEALAEVFPDTLFKEIVSKRKDLEEKRLAGKNDEQQEPELIEEKTDSSVSLTLPQP